MVLVMLPTRLRRSISLSADSDEAPYLSVKILARTCQRGIQIRTGLRRSSPALVIEDESPYKRATVDLHTCR